MCEVLDRIEEKGRTEGIEKGISIGEIKGQVTLLADRFHYSDEDIAKELNISIHQVKYILSHR